MIKSFIILLLGLQYFLVFMYIVFSLDGFPLKGMTKKTFIIFLMPFSIVFWLFYLMWTGFLAFITFTVADLRYFWKTLK